MRSHRSKQGVESANSDARRLGSRVRARRREVGLGQLALCDLAGVGPPFLYELERGKPTVRLDKVLAVLRVLGLELHIQNGRGGLTDDSVGA